MQDARDDLLRAIRHGVRLRKVDSAVEQRRTRQHSSHDVASILARRVVIEVESDSDCMSGSEWDDEARV